MVRLRYNGPMKKTAVLILFCLVAGLLPSEVGAAWVWTPQTRRWINPKYAAKDTPEAQMQWATGFFERADYPRAAKEFRRLVQAYPKSELAPEAQYLEGLSCDLMDRPESAFTAYKKVVEIYPFSSRFKDGVEREFSIAEAYFAGKKIVVAKLMKLPSLDKAIEIYQHVLDHAPFGDYGSQAQFRLGECFRKQERYEEASRAFQKVVDDYPSSPLLEQAKYNVAFCSYQLSRKPSYDQSATDEAIHWFEVFIATHPESELVPESQRSLAQLKEFKAQGLSKIAKFYEDQGNQESAMMYYRQILEQYPNSPLSAEATAKISAYQAASGRKE